MKRITVAILLFSFLSCHSKWSDARIAAYSKLPSFDVLLEDSSTHFNTQQIPQGKSTLLIYFSPDCEHCQAQTESLLANIRALKDIQIYFLTAASISELKAFSQTYHLDHYSNITTANDYQYAFFRIFKVTGFPYVVIYDNNRQLVKLYKGETDIHRIVNALHIDINKEFYAVQ
jgi:thioredoxin-related protein